MDLIASSGTESAELIGLRLRQSGLWHETVLDTARRNQALEAPGPSPHRYLTLKLDTALKLDEYGGLGGPKYGGFACLASHAWAVGNQLRAIRQAFVIAALLKRSLVLPRLTCHCDRDPSGTLTELITKGCQLPTAEAEQYLPFECPLKHLLNLEAWADAAARDATYTLLPASTVLPTASTPLTPAALATALARAGPPARQPLGAVLGEEEPTAAAVVLELTWPTTGDAPLSAKARVSSELGGRSSELGGRSLELGLELERLLALGPAGGWCISCATMRVPPSLLAFGDEINEMARSPDAISDRGSTRGGGASCRFCLNFTRLLGRT